MNSNEYLPKKGKNQKSLNVSIVIQTWGRGRQANSCQEHPESVQTLLPRLSWGVKPQSVGVGAILALQGLTGKDVSQWGETWGKGNVLLGRSGTVPDPPALGEGSTTPRAGAGPVRDPPSQKTEAALPRQADFRVFLGGWGAPVGTVEKDVTDSEDSHNFSSSQGLPVPSGHTQLSPGPQLPQHLQPSRAHDTTPIPHPHPECAFQTSCFLQYPSFLTGSKTHRFEVWPAEVSTLKGDKVSSRTRIFF